MFLTAISLARTCRIPHLHSRLLFDLNRADLNGTHTCIEDSEPVTATCPGLADVFYYYAAETEQCLSIQIKVDIVGAYGAGRTSELVDLLSLCRCGFVCIS